MKKLILKNVYEGYDAEVYVIEGYIQKIIVRDDEDIPIELDEELLADITYLAEEKLDSLDENNDSPYY